MNCKRKLGPWPLLISMTALSAFPQALILPPSKPPNLPFACPGDPPATLGSYDCSFPMSQRLQQFVGGSVSDQALLSAAFFGTVAQLRQDPGEWKQDWGGFGYRVGSRYAQGVAKGLASFTVGAIMHADPRHISYASDPGTYQMHSHTRSKGNSCEVTQDRLPGAPRIGPRIGHAFLDWVTVRTSTVCGDGRRLPNLPLFAGAAASGFSGNAWYPDRLATPQQAGIRASYSLATALGSSFYTEFSPDIGRVLGGIFKRGRTPAPMPNPIPVRNSGGNQ